MQRVDYAHFLHAIDVRIVDVEERAVAKFDPPWQLGLVEIIEQAYGEVLKSNFLVREAGGGAVEGSEAWEKEGKVGEPGDGD